jgi:septal ring factor EnvC (AmiA/AmiB activator)
VCEQAQDSEHVATLQRLVCTLEKEVMSQNQEASALRERLDKEQAKVAKLEKQLVETKKTSDTTSASGAVPYGTI